jgi:hypothetical protein
MSASASSVNVKRKASKSPVKLKKKGPFPRPKTPSPAYGKVQKFISLEQILQANPSWEPYFRNIQDKRIYNDSLRCAIEFFINKYKNHRHICKSHRIVYKIFYTPNAPKHRYSYFQRIELESRSKTRAALDIQDCFKNNPMLQLIFIPVIISHEGFNSSHQCLIIVNCVLKQIEFYDPMGVEAHHGNYRHHVLDETYHFFKQIPETSGFIFLNPYGNMLQIGLQGFESLSKAYDNIGLGGYCIAWSVFMTELRIQHPNLPVKDLYNMYTPIFKNVNHKIELTDIIINKKNRTEASQDLIDALRTFILEYTIYLEPRIKMYY